MLPVPIRPSSTHCRLIHIRLSPALISPSSPAGENEGAGFHRTWLLIKHYWHRVGGAALSWFVWDFAFYGNKLFQSTFISKIVPGGKPTLIQTLEWTLLNSAVALVGYYFAAFTVDKLWMGRKRMQVGGCVGACVCVCVRLWRGAVTALNCGFLGAQYLCATI